MCIIKLQAVQVEEENPALQTPLVNVFLSRRTPNSIGLSWTTRGELVNEVPQATPLLTLLPTTPSLRSIVSPSLFFPFPATPVPAPALLRCQLSNGLVFFAFFVSTGGYSTGSGGIHFAADPRVARPDVGGEKGVNASLVGVVIGSSSVSAATSVISLSPTGVCSSMSVIASSSTNSVSAVGGNKRRGLREERVSGRRRGEVITAPSSASSDSFASSSNFRKIFLPRLERKVRIQAEKNEPKEPTKRKSIHHPG